jgi:phosphonate transport system substrate-binding protein
MRTLLRALSRLMLLPVLALAGMASAAQSLASVAPLRIGVAPHSSARVLLEMYQPLRQYLEQSMGSPVEIVTAPDFTEFARRALAQQYDIAITTGHQARMLQTDAAYRPLLTYQSDFKAVALVGPDSSYRNPQDLNNKPVIGLSASSLVTLWGQHWLMRNGVSNARMRYVSASDSVGQLLLKGDGSVGFMSLANFQNLQPAVRDRLRVVAESLPMAGRVYVLNQRNAKRYDEIMAQLHAFAGTPDAKQYFSRYNLGGYRALEPRELVALEPYANEVRLMLKQAK